MRAVRKFVEFHAREPRNVGTFDSRLEIPDTAVHAGTAVRVMYRSDKLNPSTLEDEGWIDYFHDHDPGVRLYRCDRAAKGSHRTVPAWLRNVQELTWLGHCLGLTYVGADGEQHDVPATDPLPELFCTPNGRALLVIQGKRTLLCMLWGGRLGVEDRGIVH